MDEQPNSLKGPEQPGAKKSSALLALLVAFVPSVMLVSFATYSSGSNPPSVLCALFCLVSLGCCFGSSLLLFRRKTGLAILFGVLFLMLNGVISFFFGCATILTGMKF
jgi:hypothetical protein